MLYKLIGLLLVLPVLEPLAAWLDSLNWHPAELVIFFHLLYNSLRAVLMLPTVALMARFCNWLLPDRADDDATIRPRHLDPTALATPSLALANAVRETLRIGDVVENMLGHLLLVLGHNQPALSQELRRLDDEIDTLSKAIKLYLAQLPRETLSDEENRRWAEIIELAVNLEQAGSIIDRMLGKVQYEKTAQRRAFSEKGLEELATLHAQLMANLRLGLNVFLSGDRVSAAQLLREKRRFRAQQRRLTHAHVGRLQRHVLQSLETSSLHLELISDMKRLNSLFCASAYVVLEGAETGALQVAGADE